MTLRTTTPRLRRRAFALAAMLCGVASFVQCSSGNGRKLAVCDGKEVDLSSDRAHCGACGVLCPLSRTCFDGVCGCTVIACQPCEPSCRYGTVCVDGTCVRDPDARP